MSNQGRRIRFAPELSDFVADCDLLVMNLEGILASKRDLVLVKQYSSDSLLTDLDALVPAERQVFSLGNNHAADYGAEELARTVAKVEARGSRVLGTRAQPALRVHPCVSLHAATTLSNQPGEEVAWLDRAVPDPEAEVNLLYLHWGEEFVAYPGPEQIARGQRLLEDWNAVLGHHSHCPGPLATREIEGRTHLLAHSLGNFSCFFTAPVVRYGIVLKLALGPDATGRWGIGAVDWSFSWLSQVTRQETWIALREDCPVM